MPIIIHTSDVHLGSPLGWLGSRSGEQREQLRRTLSKIVDLVIDQRADALVVSGDLFHSNNPSPALVRFVLRELTRLTNDSRAHVILLPGSHDSLDVESVYTSYRDEFRRMERITVLGLDGVNSVKVEGAALAVHGCPPLPGKDAMTARCEMLPDDTCTFNVACYHGSVEAADAPVTDLPLAPDALSASGWSYFALGHWHSWREIEGASAPAVYPGSPELVAVDHGASGFVARVELRTSGSIVTKVRVGIRNVVESRVEVTGAEDAFSLAEMVRQQALSSPQAVLKLVLTGMQSAESGLDDSDLVHELAPDYFFVCPPVRDYHVKLSERDLAQLPERLVVGRFARHMTARLSEAQSEDERQEIEDALQLGVALLQGKDILE